MSQNRNVSPDDPSKLDKRQRFLPNNRYFTICIYAITVILLGALIIRVVMTPFAVTNQACAECTDAISDGRPDCHDYESDYQSVLLSHGKVFKNKKEKGVPHPGLYPGLCPGARSDPDLYHIHRTTGIFQHH